MRRRLAVFDSNYLCHQAKYSRKQMILRGYKNAVIHGFLHSVIEMADAVGPALAVFAWDGKGSENVRRKIYPEYKAGREAKYDIDPIEKRLNSIAFPQFWEIKDKVLPALGFDNIIHFDQYESDDIMAELSSGYTDSQTVLVTADNDMIQCITDKCVMYSPQTATVMDRKGVLLKYELADPADWAMVKAIAGCSSDNVKGIEGVGEKRATSYLFGKPLSIKHQSAIENGRDIIMRNMSLVHLPFEGFPKLKLTDNHVTLDKFLKVCGDYDLKSLVDDKLIKRWMHNYA